MAEKIVNIGGASGAWGDSPMAIPQLLTADVHYLMMDYLAEVTMSLLARARMKDANAGFPPDFVAYLKRSLPEIAKRGIKVVSNGGGVNPQGAKRALDAACAELGLSLKIAVVEGDDVLPRIDALRATVREASTGEELPPKLLTANAYLGALPIAEALGRGADIVITGRCADSALALGILMHEFGWKADDYDRLAAGSLVGHILECGPQSTGGVHTDWEKVPGWDNIGYPIASCKSDGSFVLSKPDNTGGLIVPASVAEQVLYEVGDPAAYMLPDVVADFTGVTLEQVGENRVRVSGAKGYAPTSQYKVSATFQDGWRGVAVVSIVGPDAVRKAERTAEALLARARMHFRQRQLPDFTATHIEALGSESAYASKANARHTREVLMRLVVDHVDREAIDIFARELGSVGLGFAQGTTGIFSGRPKPTPVVRLFTFFIDKAAMPAPTVQIGDAAPDAVNVPTKGGYTPKPVVEQPSEPAAGDALVEVDLRSLAVARSGDKGNGSNIAIIARDPKYVPLIRREVTTEKMAAHFEGLVHGKVTRFEAPGINAFNFLLEDALGGGGMASRRIDPQGKAFGQMALEMKVSVPRALAQELKA
ncbi:acyclic terpene utilization AtuA family protein [Pseudorhodoplanes sp.]|uniref:acyclic terpene utilization AtuA family protein n=1 Tax=Pseudorhodoplanes sp. TaxID=1934341 RepID=UPI002B52208F|nr:acyclic terpene utilization AtuA family protein [Pseudorhodoplanes sp.]HWV53673.1 acyclic terpene utilization AtuA family protein [Pseudorhodoplanes sp.]